MTIECRECRAGLEHCHGTAIVHADLTVECTEPGCDLREIVHSLRIDCNAVGCGCVGVTAAVAI